MVGMDGYTLGSESVAFGLYLIEELIIFGMEVTSVFAVCCDVTVHCCSCLKL